MEKRFFKFLIKIDSSPALILLFSEIIIGTILSIGSFLLFAKVAKNVLNNDYFNFDVAVSTFVYQFRNPFLTQIMEFFSFLGRDIVILCTAPIILILAIRKHKKEAFLFSVILFMGFIINLAIKWFIARPRPILSPLVFESFYSFPSGHAMDSFVFYSLIAFFIFRFTRNKKISITISSLSLLLVTLISISRVYLGVHYPTDVIAGMIGGFWWITTAIVVEKTIDFYKLFKILNKDISPKRFNQLVPRKRSIEN